MINQHQATQLRYEELPAGAAGGGWISILRLKDGRIIIKRFVARGNVVNYIDRYEYNSKILLLDQDVANEIVHRVLKGEPWSAALVFGETTTKELPWQKTPEEHAYTSTGIKFWRHKEAMESFRNGTGYSVISTHISPEGACNLRCPYCSVTYRNTHSRIELARVQKYVEDLQGRGLKAVILTGGGEPTLYPHFNELVQWIKGRGLSVALITNGTQSARVKPETWKAFSWVRVSINFFDGWKEKIRLPLEHLSSDCVVGCSLVWTTEHEATSEDVPMNRVELLRQVSGVADEIGAEYIRVLPNCLLPQAQLVQQHRSLQKAAQDIGDRRFFQQYKVHGAPDADYCHQSYFRPYLSEEPFHGDGEPGTVYPCDSVVLNESVAHFAKAYQLCKPEQVLDYMDGKIEQKFLPRKNCTGCVFTSTVDMLEQYRTGKLDRFAEFDRPLVHEEFV